MSWASSEVVSVLTFLLPGFVAAAVFYSLTSHPKPSAFDRVVQALIFTVVGQAIMALFFALGSSAKTDMQWLRNWEPALSVLIAVVLGLVASYASNRDTVHRILRHLGVTKETSYSSEWYSASAASRRVSAAHGSGATPGPGRRCRFPRGTRCISSQA